MSFTIGYETRHICGALMLNQLQKLINAYPNKPWNWTILSRNPNITMDDVLARPDKAWNWGSLSLNPNITIKIVLEHSTRSWN